MNFSNIKQLLKEPLPIVIGKIKSTLIKKVTLFYWGKKYLKKDFRNTHFTYQIYRGLVDFDSIDFTSLNLEEAEYLTEMYLSHRFDLLGSGWVKNSYHSESLGLESFQFKNELVDLSISDSGEWLNQIVADAHFDTSKEIWSDIVSSGAKYEPIDWQKDYKSGFRFNVKLPYHKQRELITQEGIDLKVPWELSRLQHLPQLALFARLLPHKKKEILIEYKNQTLDFIMANPPGMGVNWTCTMDVGIRAANLALAFDWFVQLDEYNLLSRAFKKRMINYLYLHGKHIVNNFEYHNGETSNHYLGNISGLAYVATYLYGSKEIDSWLLLSIQEITKELPKQFFEDGGNFEGSTSYHRLSGEMFLYSTAILNQINSKRFQLLSKVNSVRGLSQPKLHYNSIDSKSNSTVFRERHYELLAKTVNLVLTYRKPDGNITQVGDNDNGRFFRLSPSGNFLDLKDSFSKYKNLSPSSVYNEKNYWNENSINHDTYLAAINGFLLEKELVEFSERYTVEKSFVDQLIDTKIKRKLPVLVVLRNEIPKLEFLKEKTFVFNDLESSLLENIKYNYLPDFGMISYRSKFLYLNITFGNNKESHPSWGHHHNDKLSIEISVDGKDIVFDPGTYLYTPIPNSRNTFRNTKNHNTIYTGQEQNSFDCARKGLFKLVRETSVEVLFLDENKVALFAKFRDIQHIRQVDILADRIVIKDYCNKEFKQNFNRNLFSDGYGKLLNLG